MKTMLWLAPLQKMSSWSEMVTSELRWAGDSRPTAQCRSTWPDSASTSKAYSLANPMAQSFQSRPSWGATRNETG